MKPKETTRQRNLILIAFFISAVIAIALVLLIYTTRPATNLDSVINRANRLIANVGGPATVCTEASQIFRRFGVANEKFINHLELKDYPAIANLGTAHVILPGSPPRISIQVGTHRDGFFFEIIDTNNPVKYPKSAGTVELAKASIFVHR